MNLQGSGESADSRGVKVLGTFLSLMLVAVLVIAPAADAKQKHKQKKPCKDAGLIATGPKQVKRVERATRCLINRVRHRRGLTRMKANKPLLKAAGWQAEDMLSHQYFDHQRVGGPQFTDRLLRFGYADKASGYEIAENIAWASESIASPRKMVRLWMESPPHRKNILTKSYRDQAVAALWSNGPVGGAYANSGGPFLIYVNQFGTRY